MIFMKTILAVAIAAALLPLGAALAETPADRNVVAPYRFPSPSEQIDPPDGDARNCTVTSFAEARTGANS